MANFSYIEGLYDLARLHSRAMPVNSHPVARKTETLKLSLSAAADTGVATDRGS